MDKLTDIVLHYMSKGMSEDEAIEKAKQLYTRLSRVYYGYNRGDKYGDFADIDPDND